VILYKGTLHKGDDIAIGGIDTPVYTRVKAILKPKPLDEIRDPRDKFLQVEEISAAAGIKVLGPDLGGVVAGSPIKVVTDEDHEDLCFESCFEPGTDGVTIKADTLGSLEALQFECKESEVPILRTCIGPVSRSDVMEVSARSDPLERVILSFNVGTTQDAVETAENTDVRIIDGNVIYKLIEDYIEWRGEVSQRLDEESRSSIAYPAKVLLLPDCFFRLSKPAGAPHQGAPQDRSQLRREGDPRQDHRDQTEGELLLGHVNGSRHETTLLHELLRVIDRKIV
jgi:translation initiation factor 5B